MYNPGRALHLLRIGTGHPDAAFRPGQEDAIRHVAEGRGRLLVVQKTGWGKSFVYFIATKLLRDTGAGPALLVSPLLALMRNQIAAADRMGVRAVSIASDNTSSWPDIEARIDGDDVDILLISPERLNNERFQSQVLAPMAQRISLFVIDEAHCISDWGHDFRPDYRRIERIARTLPGNLRLLATTATANERVMDDLQRVLGPNLTVSRGDLNRPSLTLQTIRLPRQAERLAWLAEQLPRLPGHGIIYVLTKRDAARVAGWLASRGIDARPYTGDTANGRAELEDALIENRLKALVATTALGMGFDKPDLAFVIHFQTPGSVVAYYQQVGRAGRALDAAYGVLLSGEEEGEINDYFIDTAFPTSDDVEKLIMALRKSRDGLSVPSLLHQLNLRKGRVDKALQLLSLESPAPVVKDGTKWRLTAARLSPEFWARAERLTALRRVEQQQMQEYVGLRSGHMEFLIRALDGQPGPPPPPTLPPLPTSASPTMVREAEAYLRGGDIAIDARERWPIGGMPVYGVTGVIPAALRAEEGRALCSWGDAGWGAAVKKGKYVDRAFPDELVDACASLVRTWNPNPTPVWMTSLPSRRHPELVPGFAQRLATALAIPYHPVMDSTADRAEQKNMANSVQQALNLDGALRVTREKLPTGPVLLVDDIVDSRWTMTVAAWLLRTHGAGPVYPLALAKVLYAE